MPAGAHSFYSGHKLLDNMPPEEVPIPLQQVNLKLGYQGCLCLTLDPLLLQILLQLAGLALMLRDGIPELGDFRIELPVAVLQQTFMAEPCRAVAWTSGTYGDSNTKCCKTSVHLG